MSEKTYTPEEIIEITIKNLEQIEVPAFMVEKIGIPICQNITNLKICLQEMNKEATSDGRKTDSE